MTDQAGLVVVGYVRCSTQEQADAMSLDAQRARIESWCDAVGASLSHVVVDAGVSGSKNLSERPGGSEIAAMLAMRKPPVDAVAVVRLDRLGRNAAETLVLLRRFTNGSLGLVSITDRLDLTSPQGRALAGVTAIFSELERELIGARTAEALGELRRQGRTYGPVPFGFDDDDGRLVVNADEQRVLSRLRRMRSRGLSYARCAERLNRAGVVSKRGAQWHAMSVRSVLLTSDRLTLTTAS